MRRQDGGVRSSAGRVTGSPLRVAGAARVAGDCPGLVVPEPWKPFDPALGAVEGMPRSKRAERPAHVHVTRQFSQAAPKAFGTGGRIFLPSHVAARFADHVNHLGQIRSTRQPLLRMRWNSSIFQRSV